MLSEVRAGNGRIFAVMLRQGVLGYHAVQLLAIVMYVISPVDIIPEALVGVLGLMDDVLAVLIFLVYLSIVYRAVLVAMDRARLGQTQAGTAEGRID
ncbi:unnamed protein product [Discosporangium mesarthrocarpum]